MVPLLVTFPVTFVPGPRSIQSVVPANDDVAATGLVVNPALAREPIPPSSSAPKETLVRSDAIFLFRFTKDPHPLTAIVDRATVGQPTHIVTLAGNPPTRNS